jgi:TPP-dependent pyruvate/acetoin dehydrogenase alpha subunit
VYGVTKPAVELARQGGGCTLIELVTYRRKGHAEHDNQSYVPAEELAAWEKKDPIDRCVREFTAAGWATADELAGIDARVAALLDEAVGQCENEPMPEAMGALDGVLADPARAELEWYRRIDG